MAGDFDRRIASIRLSRIVANSSASSHGAGRGHRRLAAGAAVVDLHRADHPAALLRVGEQMADEVGGGGLAVGAGDGQRLDGVGGLAVEEVGEDGHRRRRVWHDDLRDRQMPGSLDSLTTAIAPRARRRRRSVSPSACFPGRATNRSPGCTSRESSRTPDTDRFGTPVRLKEGSKLAQQIVQQHGTSFSQSAWLSPEGGAEHPSAILPTSGGHGNKPPRANQCGDVVLSGLRKRSGEKKSGLIRMIQDSPRRCSDR